jgi:hypothetical protein
MAATTPIPKAERDFISPVLFDFEVLMLPSEFTLH